MGPFVFIFLVRVTHKSIINQLCQKNQTISPLYSRRWDFWWWQLFKNSSKYQKNLV